jgi:chemotaxis protein CheD
MGSTITVGIADLNAVASPGVLATYALGSCVGICLYDPDRKIAGLAHIMLPWSKEAGTHSDNMRRYADTGITELIQKMCGMGASSSRICAKIAGGAQMFKTNSCVFNIGDRNVEAVKKVLETYRIRLLAEETGQNFGRTVLFYSEDGIMEVRAATRQTLRV